MAALTSTSRLIEEEGGDVERDCQRWRRVRWEEMLVNSARASIGLFVKNNV